MKKLITFFSFLILTSTVFATSVGGSIGGWQVASNIAQGIGSKLTATKDVVINGASKTLSATANITPNPTNVAKFLAKAGGLSLAIDAMNQLLDGVDYVMDPANNTLTYKKKSDSSVSSDPYYPTNPSLFYIDRSAEKVSSTPESLCKLLGLTYLKEGSWIYCTDGGGKDRILAKPNPYYDPDYKPESKPITVPLSNIGSQVIDQAEKDIRSGNPTSPAVALSRAVAQDMVVEAQTDDVKARPIVQQLEQNQTYPTTEDATGTIDTPAVTDPITGEVVKPAQTSSISMKFPQACQWFPQACQFIDWAMTDPNLDEELELPEKELEKQEIKEDLIKINARSCPSDIKFDVDGLPFGIKITKGYSMQEICNTVEPLKYIFQLVTFVICCFILLRI